MPLLNIGDAEIHYRLEGPAGAPVLVLSNSLGTDLTMWAPQMPALSQAFRVLRYDTRGHGQSSVPPGPYTLARLGQDVVALLDGLDIQRAHFCGISMGGLIGQWLGLHAPERLGKLAVASTAARVGSESAWRERAAVVRSLGMDPVAAGTPGRWFTPAFVAAQPAVVSQMVHGLRASPPEGYAACCDALAEADLRQAIAAIPVPTLAIAGRLDPVTTPLDADFIASQVAGARRVDLEASHISNVEQPEAFTAALLDFLTA